MLERHLCSTFAALPKGGDGLLDPVQELVPGHYAGMCLDKVPGGV